MSDYAASMELQYVKALEARLALANEIVANLKRHMMACGVADARELVERWERPQ